MNTTVKKILAVSLLSSMLLVTGASAQTVDIAALLKQIAALQAQIAALQTGSSAPASMSACSLTRNLTVGARGADVTCLQDSLIAAGHLGAGSNTGYFGGLTKAAVSKWQSAAGVSPASGYFGPISRAKYASMGGGAPVVGGTGPSAPVPASGLAVSLTAMQPTGSAIAGAGQIDVAKWTLTASNQAGVTVTNLGINRTGVISDSNVSNLYLADEQGVIFAQYSSLNNGVAAFNGLNLMVNAGQSRVVTLRMDLSSSATAGNTLGWSLNTATTSTGGAVTGLPVAGPTLTVTSVSNPSIAAITYTYVTSGATVDAGTNGFLAHSATVNVTNSAVLLKSIKYTVVGSANTADLKNATLKISGVVVATAPTINSDGKVTFIPTTDVRLPTGNSTLEVYVDVAGSPNRTMAWNVLRPYDAVFKDTQYNSNLTATTSSSATTVTINQGRVTVNKSTDTPTANIPLGASNITLAKFSFYGGGEPIKLRFLPITITRSTNSPATAVNLDIRNVSLIDDVGNSVGTSISSPTGNWSSSAYTADFGTSSSYINYIIPANTTRVLSVKVDVQSGATATTLAASLVAQTSNYEGQISFQAPSSGTGAATGNTLTIATSPLTASANAAFALPQYVAGANGVRLASFIFTASSAEGEKISTLTLNKDAQTTFNIQNLKVMVGGTQFGTAQAIVANPDTAMTFSGSSPILVPAGGSVVVDVFGDVLTSSTGSAGGVTYTSVIDLSGASAVGSISNSSVTVRNSAGVAISTTEVAGQDVVLLSGSTLTLATASDNVAGRFMTMGSTDNVLYSLRLTANNTEDIRVTDISFLDTIGNNTAGSASFSNLRLYDGDTLLAGPVNMTVAATTTGNIVFSLGSTSSLLVLKNTSKTVNLRGDVANFPSAISNSTHLPSIAATSSVTAYGKDSSAVAIVSGAPTGTTHTVFRTKPSLVSSVLGTTTARTRASVDDISTLNWAANAAGDLTLGTVSIKFSGQAVSNGSTAFTVDLIDSQSGLNWGSSSQRTCTPGAGNSCSVTFAPTFVISAGNTKTVKVRVNSSSFFNSSTAGAESVSMTVNAAGDILWNDCGANASGGLCANSTLNNSWEAYQLPIILPTVSYE